ncbi:hypothetical protein COT75_01990 [Candidatus Beckwithbacteria bacterium CG10_big_fil_rev_8_21_14_0_10_34_10]|uniref:Adenosine monophosphate-protein transferase n=1 Tax=Candidatus Beckwithbacteria bacterium CG10_big_fil_rev_8_21_14_0_10_34_10 TaxID=1974495 RepID=A0A2H0W9I5_9BACT|nr:MAG: hypothetical protein COT75_01990 [Candidatus Beckwithbacteria bacterium CG10_big_fil_rev_8_21_14_0_10_34_10]
MSFKTIKIKNPQNLNLIFGQSHFIKTVEDLHEVLVSCVPGVKFGLAFAEASGPRMIRTSGTDKALEKLAAENLKVISAGHSFLIFLKDSFPINFLPRIKQVEEVCQIFCATANPVEVILFEGEKGKAVLGVIDGFSPLGVEKKSETKKRKDFLRKIGYKL